MGEGSTINMLDIWTVAEIFVPLAGTEKEIHGNSQMGLDGMGYHYARYSGDCPNEIPIAGAEEQAKTQSVGVWTQAGSMKPWDWREK